MPVNGPIRVLRIIARLNIGGPAIQAITLTAGLEGGALNTLLVCGTKSSKEGDMMYLADALGLHPIVIPELGRAISPFADLKAFLSIRKIMKGFSPHIVHTHTAKAGTLGRLAAFSLNLLRAKQDRIRTVHTFHGHVFEGYFGRAVSSVFIMVEKLLARITDAIIVISPSQRKDLCTRFGVVPREKTRMIPLGFDLSNFNGTGRERSAVRRKFMGDRTSDLFLFGSVGRLTPVKDHALLLKGMRRLIDLVGVDRVRVLVVGDGELRDDLARKARALGIEGLMIFCGWQKEMPPIYEALDAVVLTSKNEGTPVALIEAMAAEKPVVATDVGGVRDLLGAPMERLCKGVSLTDRGILIPSGDEEALAAAMFHVVSFAGHLPAITQRAKEFVLAHYCQERLSRDIHLLYRELTAHSGLPVSTGVGGGAAQP